MDASNSNIGQLNYAENGSTVNVYNYPNPKDQLNYITLTTIPAPVELIGRQDDISNIRGSLSQYNVVSLRADGGVGKTAVATKIINNVKGEIERGNCQFNHVAWITSTGDLKSDLSNVSVPAVETSGSVDEKFREACRFLQEHATFLVIDNMDNPPDVDDVNNINTISGSTKILITTAPLYNPLGPYTLRLCYYTLSLSLNALPLAFSH